MISRVAEACFWLHRYAERADNTARLLRVNHSFVLDVSLPELDRWNPVIVVSGEQQRFPELTRIELTADGEAIQDYSTWDERNPVSIVSSMYWARENARTIREVISREMWEAQNGHWHWLTGGEGKDLYHHDRDAFYRRVQDAVALFQGVCQSTLLHGEPFDFMQLGTLLERAGQTARILDVKYHTLGPTGSAGAETPLEAAHWLALLRSCSAIESFLKRSRREPHGSAIVEFLLWDEHFPRSILYCWDRSRRYLDRICRLCRRTGLGSSAMLESLLDQLRTPARADLLAAGVHEELTRIIDATTELCTRIHHDFFAPSFANGAPAATPA